MKKDGQVSKKDGRADKKVGLAVKKEERVAKKEGRPAKTEGIMIRGDSYVGGLPVLSSCCCFNLRPIDQLSYR
jgi:hypothetical protein